MSDQEIPEMLQRLYGIGELTMIAKGKKSVKAISLWEPWASLVRTGAKTWETRGWRTHYRGELLICSASGGLPMCELIFFLSHWQFQGGLAPLIGKPLDMTFKTWAGVKHTDLNFGKAVALVALVDCKPTDDLTLKEIDAEKVFGSFEPGRFAWKLKLIDGSFEPFPVKGKRGFFNVDFPKRRACENQH